MRDVGRALGGRWEGVGRALGGRWEGVGRALGGRWEGVGRALGGRWEGVGLASGEGRPHHTDTHLTNILHVKLKQGLRRRSYGSSGSPSSLSLYFGDV